MGPGAITLERTPYGITCHCRAREGARERNLHVDLLLLPTQQTLFWIVSIPPVYGFYQYLLASTAALAAET